MSLVAAVFIALLLLVVLVIFASRLRRDQIALEEQRGLAGAAEREASELRHVAARLQQDQHFLFDFMREFPHLTRELHGGVSERQIPTVVLNITVRSLQPQQALVLVRRRSAGSDPERAQRLVVAAATPAGCPIKPGLEILVGHGELGYAAQTQRVMTRADFDSESPVTRMRLRQESLPMFEADLAAPMVFGDEVLGLIALSRPSRTSEDAKAVVRLIAQTGAHALHDAAAYGEMKLSADLDGLTKVFNKRRITQTLAELIYEADQQAAPLSIFIFDIDHFKNYNDLNGHVAGDRLLQMLARLIGENVRKDDVFGRFGGEEFLLILPNTRLPQALCAAYKIRATISAHAFPFAQRQPLGFVSVSGGVAEYPTDGRNSTALLHAADQALYQAKHEGRNRVLAAVRDYLGDEPVAPCGFEVEP